MVLRKEDKLIPINRELLAEVKRFVNERRKELGAPEVKTDSAILALLFQSFSHHVMRPYFDRMREIDRAERRYKHWAARREAWQARLREGKVITDAEVLEYQRVMAEPAPGEE